MSGTYDTTTPAESTARTPTHVLDVDDFDPGEIERVLDRAADLKGRLARGEPHRLCQDATVALLFEKPSTRTRVSFEAGVTQLGGNAVFLGPDETHLGHGEPIRDTARSLSGYVDAIVARLFDHQDLRELASYSSVPVINGLTDLAHPCQTLGDLLTVREHCGDFDGSVAWVGDANNVARSFVLGAAAVGLDLTVATPPGYELDDGILDRAAEMGSRPETTTDPLEATADADVVYTDVWISMGHDEDRDAKVSDFETAGFRVTADRLPSGAALMHCLPAHRGEEVTDDAIEDERSIVWRQAENRLHVQKALLAELIG